MNKAFEIWKDINSFEGIYQISDKGNIRSLDRKIICSNGSVRFQRGSGIKPYINKQGYRTVVLHNNGKHKMCRICRLVAEAFIPNPLSKEQVNHIDGNKKNNCVWNLEWCTDKENANHALKTGLRKNEKVKIVETGEIFENAYECAKAINGNAQDIYRCLYGKTKTHKKYHYEVVV